jgi:hypothetical protein
MADITIDGKEYNKEEMSNEQIAIVGKLANIQQSKNNLLSQIQDLEILAEVWVNKFKQAKPKDIGRIIYGRN